MSNKETVEERTKRIREFYREIADVCAKYHIQAIVGMWFDRGSDNYGFIKNYDIADLQMKHVCDFLQQKWELWEKEIVGTPVTEDYIKEARIPGNNDQN